MSNKNYVYVYLDQRKPGRYCYANVSLVFEPFYVGQGRGIRWLRHRYISAKRTDEKSRRIREIKDAVGEWPLVVTLAESLSRDKALEVERQTIKMMGRTQFSAGPLLNCNDGGAGAIGRPMQPHVKAALEAARARRIYKTGWHHSAETRRKMRMPKSPEAIANMRAARRARPDHLTPEVRAKISVALKGRPLPEATRLKMKGRIPWNKKCNLPQDART